MDSTGNEFRLQKIGEIQEKLEAEKEKRIQLSKKYKLGIKVVNATDYILAAIITGSSAVGVGLLATIIASPALITTETVTLGASILVILSRQVNRKLKAKAKKHEKLRVLAENILNKISNHISIALTDNKISAEEFTLILTELNTFLETKEKLHSKSKQNDVESAIVNPFLQRIQTNNVKNSV